MPTQPLWQWPLTQDVLFEIMLNTIKTYLKGICMGVADVIPGISGGTLALMLGVYERLIASIKSISPKVILKLLKNIQIWDKTKRQEFIQTLNEFNAFFLFTLGFGIISAILATSSIIPHLILNHTANTFSCFLGLIAPSIYIPWSLIKKKSAPQMVALAIGLILTVSMAALMKDGAAGEATKHSFPIMATVLFGSAVIAISAMILPGISGSFILILLGQYIVVTGLIAKLKVDILNKTLTEEKMAALSHIQHFSTLEAFTLLSIFAIGCACGLLIMSRIVHFALQKAHDTTMAFLTGMICSSFYVLWPFKEAISDGVKKSDWLKNAANVIPSLDSKTWISISLFAVTFMVSTSIVYIGERKKNDTPST